MAQALKVLVTGPITSLDAYCIKLAQLQSKHSFSLVVAQDLFSHLDPASHDQQVHRLVNGEYSLPVQVYATYGRGKLPSRVQEKVDKGEEVCPNLNVLRESLVRPLDRLGKAETDKRGVPRPQPKQACSASRPDSGSQPSPAPLPPPKPTPTRHHRPPANLSPRAKSPT